MTRTSPYERALGERTTGLHPSLQRYFTSLPAGAVGFGEGAFDRAGTPQPRLRPALAPLQALGVLYAGWEQDVPFRISNRLVHGRVIAERRFAFGRGEWIMRDSVGLNAHGRLVDEIGGRIGVVASFDVGVQDGALTLTSRAVGIRIGRLRVRLPRCVAPVVSLRESFDEPTGGQRVELTIDQRWLGRVYEYGGLFRYRVEEDT